MSDDQQLFSVALLEGYLLLASSLLVTRAFCLRSCKVGTRANKLPQVFEVTLKFSEDRKWRGLLRLYIGENLNVDEIKSKSWVENQQSIHG